MFLLSSFTTKNFPPHMSKTIEHKLYLEDFQIKLFASISYLLAFESLIDNKLHPQILLQSYVKTHVTNCPLISINFLTNGKSSWIKNGNLYNNECFIVIFGTQKVKKCMSTSTRQQNGENTLQWPPLVVILYYFLGACMFECIPLQTFKRFSHYFCILC
jgi:hypothetical protein